MMSNNKGFSLIELMVVVAIIGILSAVAVPQFQKFQRKARQSEARANLAGIYSGQKIFLAKYNTYYRNMIATGWSPEGKMNYRYYSAGGSAPNPDASLNTNPLTQYNYHYDTYYTCGSTFAYNHPSWDPTGAVAHNCLWHNIGAIPGGRVLTATTFAISASANIGGAVHDQWLINQRKEFIHVANGAL